MSNKEFADHFWSSAFGALVCCPDCQQNSLSIDGISVRCLDCNAYFEYKNEIPHLYAKSFKEIVERSENGNQDALSEEAILKANLLFHNENAEGYDEDPAIHHLLSKTGQSLIRECVKYCQDNTDGQVWVDAGCGTGQVMSIAEKFPLTLGFDISESMATLAKQKGHQTFLGDAYHIPCCSETVDLVSACAVLHHLPDPVKFLKEVHRVLKPGGMLFTDFDPNNRPSHDGVLLKLLRKLYWRMQPKGKSMHTVDQETEEQSKLADYQMFYNNNFNGDYIRSALREVGFRDIRVDFYFDKAGLDAPDKPALLKIFRRILMAPASGIFDWKELAPYFLVLAKK